jgi:hypothetical protein
MGAGAWTVELWVDVGRYPIGAVDRHHKRRILAIVIFISAIVIHLRIKHRLRLSLEATTPCPKCGQCRMSFREERDMHAYLICPHCGIKWDLGQI